METPTEEVPSVFKKLLVEKIENLNDSQKKVFATFLERNKDVFSGNYC